MTLYNNLYIILESKIMLGDVKLCHDAAIYGTVAAACE
jgi:hypothetical protein